MSEAILQEILDAINTGTNAILTQIQTDVALTSTIISNVNTAVNEIVPQVEKIIQDITPVLANLKSVEDNINRIVTLLFVILIVIIIIIFIVFIFWFFRNIYPILRGLTPKPKSFDDFIMSRQPVVSESRKNDVEQLYTASEHSLSREEFKKRYKQGPVFD